MFTGIIESIAPILQIREGPVQRILKIKRPAIFDDIKEGASIACDGICLTVLAHDSQSFEVEVMGETIAKSTAKTWKTGSRLNLERALRLGSRLDGHLVQGHIDRVLALQRIQRKGIALLLYFPVPREDASLLVPQGSIALNGVSLTLAELSSQSFAVALITHTIQNSNLAGMKPGDEVNVEYDVIGKYMNRRGEPNALSQGWLHEMGF